jgi:hypothetical protein
MEYYPVFLLIVAAIFLITRMLTVLLHELGHGISAILLTRQKMTLYAGSYRATKGCLKINMGLLAICIRYNPFTLTHGLCPPPKII